MGISQQTYAVIRTLPRWEARILMDVGQDYRLDGRALRLLFVIRKIENGGPGLEMGVLNGAARRHAGDSEKSLRLQASWAAGTIQKRFTGDLKTFAQRYCPADWPHWYRMAASWMERR